jgi:hypothetical protein
MVEWAALALQAVSGQESASREDAPNGGNRPMIPTEISAADFEPIDYTPFGLAGLSGTTR